MQKTCQLKNCGDLRVGTRGWRNADKTIPIVEDEIVRNATIDQHIGKSVGPHAQEKARNTAKALEVAENAKPGLRWHRLNSVAIVEIAHKVPIRAF
ncbi:hypothetical protein [Methylomonas sp. MK1]|uniref:hypothetical protein n=1 Tax=Methylomonas sp. MK1 TaxID=1131552 RepID=UPI0003742270|nr:hypothetical protein [Methylomonas sp. MK1]